MKKMIIIALLAITGAVLPLPSFAFNSNFILSDRELEDSSSMNAEEIKQFLVDNGSFLAYYADFWPGSWAFMEASEIIAKTAEEFKINPKFLLVLLEKEQGLVSTQKPAQKRLDWAMGYAVCDKCLLSNPLVAQYKGFAKQVYYATRKIRESYLADLAANGKTSAGIGPGIVKKIDAKYITPANNATSVLYTYTPHIPGNKNFYLLWRHWFLDIVYPDGALLQDAKTGTVYLIENGMKRPFPSKAALSEFGAVAITPVMTKFLAQYPDGKPLPEKDASNDGSLFQNNETGGVYWVADSVKHPIWDKSVLLARFPNAKITKTAPKELENYETGDPVKFIGGMLVKSVNAPTIYVVSQGKLRPIASEDTFLTFGWDWKNVIKTIDKVLALHEIGDPISLDNLPAGQTDIAGNAETALTAPEDVPAANSENPAEEEISALN